MLSFKDGRATMAFAIAGKPLHRFAVNFDPYQINEVLVYLAGLAYERDGDLGKKYPVTDEQCQELIRTLMLELAHGKMEGRY